MHPLPNFSKIRQFAAELLMIDEIFSACRKFIQAVLRGGGPTYTKFGEVARQTRYKNLI